MRIWLVGLCCLLFVSPYTGLAHAVFLTSVTASVKQSPGGIHDYTYTLSVSPASDSLGLVFGINVGPAADLRSFISPAGWEVGYAPGSLGVGWQATDFGALVLPGNSVVFGFSSALGPSPQAYAVQGINLTTFDLPVTLGETLAPASIVPEPMSGLLLSVGIFGIIVRLSTRSRRGPTHTKGGSSRARGRQSA